MPGSTPATSQLDWLISTTAMLVLSWSKATRDLLKACPGEGRGRSAGASGHYISWLQRRWCHLLAACPIPSLCWSKADSNSGSHPRATPPAATRFVADSALEEDGFEPSVPLTKRVALFRRSGRCLKEEAGEPQGALGAPIPRSQPGDKGD